MNGIDRYYCNLGKVEVIAQARTGVSWCVSDAGLRARNAFGDAPTHYSGSSIYGLAKK
jgi:hypothetical protein